VLAIATELEQELADVGLGSHENEQHGVGAQDRYHGESGLVFEDRGGQWASVGGSAQLVGGADDRRNSRPGML
jgi:hypothetical protein